MGPDTFISASRGVNHDKWIIVENEKIAELFVMIEICEKKPFEAFKPSNKSKV